MKGDGVIKKQNIQDVFIMIGNVVVIIILINFLVSALEIFFQLS